MKPTLTPQRSQESGDTMQSRMFRWFKSIKSFKSSLDNSTSQKKDEKASRNLSMTPGKNSEFLAKGTKSKKKKVPMTHQAIIPTFSGSALPVQDKLVSRRPDIPALSPNRMHLKKEISTAHHLNTGPRSDSPTLNENNPVVSRSFHSMQPSSPPTLSSEAMHPRKNEFPRTRQAPIGPDPGDSILTQNDQYALPRPDIPALSPRRMHSVQSGKSEISITPLDHIIKTHGGNTAATDRLSTEMEKSKHRRVQSSEEENIELKRLVGRLQAEVAFLTETRAAMMDLYADVVKVYQETISTQDKLQSSIQRSTIRMQKAENHLLDFWGIQVKSEPDDSFF